jgi:predicted secreted protein
MNIGGAIVIFVLIWWSVFFAVLPWGVRGRWESEDDGVKGAEPGAPVRHNLKRKALITTVIAAAFWVLTVAIILSGVISYND